MARGNNTTNINDNKSLSLRNIPDSNDARLQSSLGISGVAKRRDKSMSGQIMAAQVIKVHHKHHTADIVLLQSKDTITSDETQEGRHAAIITEQHAGWVENREVYYGNYTAIEEGAYVLVCFAENYKAQPFIIGSFHRFEEEKNPFPLEYPLEEEGEESGKQMYESYSITRNQDFFYKNGFTDVDIAHRTKAFLSLGTGERDDSKNGFLYKDLAIKNKLTGETLWLPWENDDPTVFPLDILLSLQDKPEDADAGFLKFWATAKTGAYRISKTTNGEPFLTSFEITADGSTRIRRQKDSDELNSGGEYADFTIDDEANITIKKCNKSKELTITIDENANFSLVKTDGANTARILIDDDCNIVVDTDKAITISGTERVDITSDRVINLTAPAVNINSGG